MCYPPPTSRRSLPRADPARLEQCQRRRLHGHQQRRALRRGAELPHLQRRRLSPERRPGQRQLPGVRPVHGLGRRLDPVQRDLRQARHRRPADPPVPAADHAGALLDHRAELRPRLAPQALAGRGPRRLGDLQQHRADRQRTRCRTQLDRQAGRPAARGAVRAAAGAVDVDGRRRCLRGLDQGREPGDDARGRRLVPQRLRLRQVPFRKRAGVHRRRRRRAGRGPGRHARAP